VLVLVANRLCRPGSEHALAQWLESDFVCGRDGKRILARWKQQGRVRVAHHVFDGSLPDSETVETGTVSDSCAAAVFV
jgi:hypothetical protein